VPTLLSDSELLTRLVAFDSTSNQSTDPIVGFISDYLDGLATEIIPVGPTGTGKENLVIAFGPLQEGGKGLILSGHMDVVPARESGWEGIPFVLRSAEDRYYGRGTADMKGFLAVAMNAAATLDLRSLTAPLLLLFTYDEEVGTLGARYFREHWAADRPLPRNVVIGEPTSLHPVRMHKGHLKLRISVSGLSAHSGYPHLGINAIEEAVPVLGALRHLRQDLEREQQPNREFFPDVPYAPLNIGTVHGGAAINIVPSSCIIEVGVRLLPGMDEPAMVERVRAAVEPLGGDLSIVSSSPPMWLDADSEVHRETAALAPLPPEPSVSFATDAGWLQTMGLDCVIFGPGSIEVAHRPNEFVPRQDLESVAGILPRLIHRFCGEQR
jgi:acetylornithine deacetylase